MIYHIMPSVIVLLKSYTPAVLLLSLPLPNFSAACILPQGRVWEVAEWVVQSGWVVIGKTGSDQNWTLRSYSKKSCKADKNVGIQMEDIEQPCSKFLYIQLGLKKVSRSSTFSQIHSYIVQDVLIFQRGTLSGTGWQQKCDYGVDGSFRIICLFFSSFFF